MLQSIIQMFSIISYHKNAERVQKNEVRLLRRISKSTIRKTDLGRGFEEWVDFLYVERAEKSMPV